MRWAALMLLVCTGAALAEDDVVYMPPPEGWPWKLGDVFGKVGKSAMIWETYDFSIGALDASVWAGNPWGPVQFWLRGMKPGRPESTERVLQITATFGDALHVGTAQGPVLVEIFQGAKSDGPRMSSEGRNASLTIRTLEKDPDDINYGTVTGTVTARLCPIRWPKKTCQDFNANFTTRMQFDGDFEIRFGGE